MISLKLNRNHYLLFGVLLVLLGAQFRLVERVRLNPKASEVLARQTHPGPVTQAGFVVPRFFGATPQRYPIEPPKWIGWALLSVGAVLTLHGVAMPKPQQ